MNYFNYSPSLNHKYLMEQMKPSMTFDETDVLLWQKELRRKLYSLLGDFPKSKYPLNIRSQWRKQVDLGTIEKFVFSSEPFVDIPAYICLPDNAAPPYKTFICLQGHSIGISRSIENDTQNDLDFALQCMKNGFAALCIEQRSFGERVETVQKMRSPHQCHDAVCQALMLGRTLIGERIWDIDCALDYLASRGDIAMNSIGLMGHSGGGTVSMYASAVLDRIAFCMPACSFCTFEDSIMNIYHCADNYISGLFKYAEMADIMGLHAPKPVVIVTGEDDITFPVKAVKKAFCRLKEIYRAFGKEENCQLVIGDGGHRFFVEPSWRIMKELINKN